MDALRIQHLELRYRLPGGDPGVRDRLDRALGRDMEGLLEVALERAGVAVSEEICVRSLSAPARVRLEGTDVALATEWARAFAAALKVVIDRGGDGVVRYRTRHRALLDVVERSAAGDVRRAWAWKQLGLWPAVGGVESVSAARHAVEALVRHPQAVVGVLHELAVRGRLAALWALLGAEEFRALIRAALQAAGAGDVEVAALLELSPALAHSFERSGPVSDGPLAREPEQIWMGSAIGRALAEAQAALERAAPDARTRRISLRALAVLALLDHDPGFARSTLAAWRLAAIEARASRRAGKTADEDWAEKHSARAHRSESDEQSETERGPSDADATESPRARAADQTDDEREAALARERAKKSEADRPARTDSAGLLFLLHLAEHLHELGATRSPQLARNAQDKSRAGAMSHGRAHDQERGAEAGGVSRVGDRREERFRHAEHADANGSDRPMRFPDAICADDAFADRDFRWVMHRLGMTIAGAAPDDPAVLAFAGLGPTATPPSRGAPPPTERERDALLLHTATLVAGLRSWLERTARDSNRPSELLPKSDAALLQTLCRRRGVIIADPAWLEVRLDLDEVSTELRRAGLDLDPGWLPWLGVIVRFTYA